MRARRQEIKLLEDGGADEDDIIVDRARYRGTSAEYAQFSKAMDIPQQRERVTVDGLGNVGRGKYKILTNEEKQDILKNKIAKGVLTKTLFEPKQSPHIFGSLRYNENQKKSYFTVSQDAIQEIVDKKYATGDVLIKRSGQIKEIIEIPEGIAYIVDEDGNNLGTTNRATIHYSKSRTHIVPARRGVDNNA